MALANYITFLAYLFSPCNPQVYQPGHIEYDASLLAKVSSSNRPCLLTPNTNHHNETLKKEKISKKYFCNDTASKTSLIFVQYQDLTLGEPTFVALSAFTSAD